MQKDWQSEGERLLERNARFEGENAKCVHLAVIIWQDFDILLA